MSTVDDIKDRLNIVDVVSEYFPVRKAGSNYKAACPFHKEKTPSFVVNLERQSWRCFGACATGGDIFSFIMRIENLEFGEALRLLAEKAGVTLQDRTVKDGSEPLYKINLEATSFYQKVLNTPEGLNASNYLEDRGVDLKTISDFQLGMSPSGGARLKEHLSSLGFDLDLAIKAGLLKKTDSGIIKDFFWNRLMFPIHDRKGQVTGFGGRSLDNSNPKYINTSSTPVFDKRTTLYGLHMSSTSIIKESRAIVVEGYMDTITAHQFGYSNVVASMGTALTEQQVQNLRSSAKTVIQALDPDIAGQEATLNSLESAYHALERRSIGQKFNLDLRIAHLTNGLDPDQLIRQDYDGWKRVISEAVPFMEFLIPAKTSKYDLSTAEGKAQAAAALLPVILAENNSLKQDEYFQSLSVALGVTRQALEASIGKLTNVPRRISKRQNSPPPNSGPLDTNRINRLEDYVLSTLLKKPEWKTNTERLLPEHFHKIENKTIFTEWLGCDTIDELRTKLDELLYPHLDYLENVDLEPAESSESESALTQSVRRMELRHLRNLQEELLDAEDSKMPPSREVEATIEDLNARLKELYLSTD